MRQVSFAFFLAISLSMAHANPLADIEQDISDSVITTKITAKFAKNKHLNLLNIFISTQNGKVSLSGFVDTQHAYLDAVRLASNTKGVRYVDAEGLTIGLVNTSVKDGYITAKVMAALMMAKILDDESIPIVGIRASTDNGIVTLTGNVKSSKSIHVILKRVNSLGGVKKIISHLHVSQRTT